MAKFKLSFRLKSLNKSLDEMIKKTTNASFVDDVELCKIYGATAAQKIAKLKTAIGKHK